MACAAAGCSSSTGKKATYSGKVFVGSEAMDGGTLVFVPVNAADGGGKATQVSLEGEYSITFQNAGKMKVYVALPVQPPKLPPGVSIGPKTNTPAPENAPTSLPPPRQLKVVVPPKYLNANTTDKIVDVEFGKHDLDIEFQK
jgi:hypothetical protein